MPASAQRSGRQAPGATPSGTAAQQPIAHSNTVELVGRVASTPDVRQLPSGDQLVAVRLIVERETPTSRDGSPVRRSVDTIDCSCFTAATRRAAQVWAAGDVVSVSGRLRRRFFHAGGGAQSRYDVEVFTARRLRRAGG